MSLYPQRHSRLHPAGANWTPAPNRKCSIVGTLPAGVTFDPDTGLLEYDGIGAGGVTTVRLKLAYEGGEYFSDPFTVRVAVPNWVYGHGAAAANIWGLPASQVFDSAEYSVENASSRAVADGTEDDPFIGYIVPGTYLWTSEFDRQVAEQAKNMRDNTRLVADITIANPAVVTFTAPHALKKKSGSEFASKNFTGYGFTGDWAWLNGQTLSMAILDTSRVALYWQGTGDLQLDEDGEPLPETDIASIPVDTTEIPAEYTGDVARPPQPYAGGASAYVGNRVWEMAHDCKYSYLLSDPQGMATFTEPAQDMTLQPWDGGYSTTFLAGLNKGSRTTGTKLYMQRIELRGTVILDASGAYAYGGPSEVFVRHCRFRYSWPRSDDGLGPWMDDAPTLHNGEDGTQINSVRRGLALVDNPCRLFVTSSQFEQWGGTGLYHYIYQHGRPNGWTIVNGCSFEGKGAGSMIKGTHWFFHIRNSEFYASHRTLDRMQIKRADGTDAINSNGELDVLDTSTGKCLDTPCIGDIIVFNNRFVCWNHSNDRTTDFVWLTQRRSLWGASDGSMYPNICYQAAPFAPFPITFRNSGLNNAAATNVRFEGRLLNSGAAYTTIATTAIGQELNNAGNVTDWLLTVDPTNLVTGNYQVRMAADGFTAGEPPASTNTAQMQIYRNANYLLVSGMQEWTGLTDLLAWADQGPKRYAVDDGAEFYDAMVAAGIERLDNPYTVNAFLTCNDYINLHSTRGSGGSLPAPLVTVDGDVPKAAVSKASLGSRWGGVPPNWLPRTVVRFANNYTQGYTEADIASGGRQWIELGGYAFDDTKDIWVDIPEEAKLPNPAESRIFGLDALGNVVEGIFESNTTPRGTVNEVPLPLEWKV